MWEHKTGVERASNNSGIQIISDYTAKPHVIHLSNSVYWYPPLHCDIGGQDIYSVCDPKLIHTVPGHHFFYGLRFCSFKTICSSTDLIAEKLTIGLEPH